MLKPHHKIVCCTSVVLLLASTAHAHVIVDEMESLSGAELAFSYLKLGFRHILPLGFDHILFVLSLFLLNPKLKSVVIQSTIFTLAHSITLGLAMYGVLSPPASLVEPLISISIVFVALQNIIAPSLRPSRLIVIFIFGLVHGLGFASSLSELGLPQHAFLSSLVLFNLGVELGQLAVILLAFLLIGIGFGKKTYYRKLIVVPASLLIILVASYWTIARIFFT